MASPPSPGSSPRSRKSGKKPDSPRLKSKQERKSKFKEWPKGEDGWDDSVSPEILRAHQKMHAKALTSAQYALAEMEQQLASCRSDLEQAHGAEAARQRALFIRKESRQAGMSAAESLESTLKRQTWVSDKYLAGMMAPHIGDPCGKHQNPPLTVWRQALQETRGVKLPVFVPVSAPMLFGHIQAALVSLALEEAQRSGKERLDLAAEDNMSQWQELEASLDMKVQTQERIQAALEQLRKREEDQYPLILKTYEKAKADADENTRQIDLMEAARAKEFEAQRRDMRDSVADRRARLEAQRRAKEADDIWTGGDTSDRKHVPKTSIARSPGRVPVTKSGPRGL